MEYRLTTDHAASSYGQPVLVDEDGEAYGVADVLPNGQSAEAYVAAELQDDPHAAAFLTHGGSR